MNAKAPERPTGDTVADKISKHSKTDSFADVASDLTADHARRPGLWQQDLQKANDAFHKQGLLPGLDIVGIRGQDFVTKDKDGKVQVYDATNLNNHHEDKAGGATTIGGRDATVNPDGSGQLKVKQGDNDWTITRDVLKSQGIDKPTNNQVANYIMELEKANGKKLDKLHPGDTIKLPPSARGGDSTEFVGDRAEAAAVQAKDQAEKTYQLAQAAQSKFAGADTPFLQQTIPPSITQADITKALAGNITDDERKGLTFLRDNYDKLKDTTGGIWKKDVIFSSNLSDWRDNQVKAADQKKNLAYLDGT